MKIDIVITTMDRPECLKNLLESIYKYYPDFQYDIYIADQSKHFLPESYQIRNENVIRLPFDCGLSYARNYLFDYTPSPYKLLLDDDFIFNEHTNIETLLEIAEHLDADIIGASVINPGNKLLHYEFDFEIKGDILYQTSIDDHFEVYNGIQYKKCDCVLNFGLFKKDIHRWDNDLKVMEHMNFYVRLLGKANIYYVPQVSIDHNPVKTEDYKLLRHRKQFLYLSMKKTGISKIMRDGKFYFDGKGTTIYRRKNNKKKKKRFSNEHN